MSFICQNISEIFWHMNDILRWNSYWNDNLRDRYIVKVCTMGNWRAADSMSTKSGPENNNFWELLLTELNLWQFCHRFINLWRFCHRFPIWVKQQSNSYPHHNNNCPGRFNGDIGHSCSSHLWKARNLIGDSAIPTDIALGPNHPRSFSNISIGDDYRRSFSY